MEYTGYDKLKPRGISHVCLRVYDLERTVKFYQDVFGATIVCEWGKDENEDHAIFVDLGTGDYLEIFNALPPAGYDPSAPLERPSTPSLPAGTWQHVAIWTDDIEATYRRALECGALGFSKPGHSDIPTRSGATVSMKYGFVRAPGGEYVEFIEHIPQP